MVLGVIRVKSVAARSPCAWLGMMRGILSVLAQHPRRFLSTRWNKARGFVKIGSRSCCDFYRTKPAHLHKQFDMGALKDICLLVKATV